MPIPIQQGGIADRLRNFARLVGRAGTALDEIVVPVLQVQQLDQPPYRTAERKWRSYLSRAPVAAVYGVVGVVLPERVGGAAVIEQIILSNPAAGASEYQLILIDSPAVVLANYASQFVVDVEQMADTASGTVPRTAPVIFSGTTATAPAGWEALAIFRLVANETVIIPVQMVLRGRLLGDLGATRGIAVMNTAVNDTMRAGFAGDYIPDAE